MRAKSREAVARAGSQTSARVTVFESGRESVRSDQLATEEPLELRLVLMGQTRTLAVTMRTPGADFELAAGFLHGEGVVDDRDQIRGMSYCTDPEIDAEQQFNIVNVELDPAMSPDLRPLERHFYTTSACGVCGKASIEALSLRGCPVIGDGPRVEAKVISGLGSRLRSAQGIFESTGGLHAAALFDVHGELQAVREDVGRHNAVDKLIGWALMEGRLPLSNSVVMVSGRSSFEILQKSLAAGAPIVCAVSAPSSLAVQVATEFNMTLIGFLRENRFNIYSGAERIV
jgi:FdhD protein